MNAKTLYEILSVPTSATSSEIKTAFHSLAHIYHPDKNNNSTKSQLNFLEILNAYEILSADDKRKEYDLFLERNHKSLSTLHTRHIDTANHTLENVLSQLNYILWEIEDLLNRRQNRENRLTRDSTINETLLIILIFLDKWVLEPAGCGDFFFSARRIADKKSSETVASGFSSRSHTPYTSLKNYFYEIRKRSDKYLNLASVEILMQTFEDSKTSFLTALFEAERLAYHYLSEIQMLLSRRKKRVSPFQFSHMIFSENSRFIDEPKPGSLT